MSADSVGWCPRAGAAPAVLTAVTDLGLGDLADLPIAAPSTPDQVAERRQLLTRLIAGALNAEPAPPADLAAGRRRQSLIRVGWYVASAGGGSRVALAAATRASIRPACGPYISNIVSELRTEFLTLMSSENSTVPPSAA
jgi:hypothetical protein